MQHDPSPSETHGHAPSRHRQALLTFVGLVAPVYFIPPALASVLPLGRFAIVVASLALIVPLMSYVIMPALQWLFGPTRRKPLSPGESRRSSERRRPSPRARERRALTECHPGAPVR